MEWLTAILENLVSSAIWKYLAILVGPSIFIAWLGGWISCAKEWWSHATSQGKFLAAVGVVICFAAAVGGVHFATKKPPPVRAESPFAILVADLEGDSDLSQTRHIRQSLETQFGAAMGRGDIEILSRGEVLNIPHDGNLKTGLEVATGKGRVWLKEQNASVLIWGEAAARDKLLRLRFLPAEGDGSAKSYALIDQTLELPTDFGGDLGTAFAGQAAAAISPVYQRSGEALANLITPFVAKLKPLAEKPPASFSDQTRAQFWDAYAAGEQQLGNERGDYARLVVAIAFYKKALTIWTRESVPLDWARTQNNLGNALSTLGERESGTARLEEAVSAYGAALLEWTRERVPLLWAATQNNSRHIALQDCFGERESGAGVLRRLFRPIVRPFWNVLASVSHCTGPRRRTISVPPCGGSASARAGRRGLRRRSWPIATR